VIGLRLLIEEDSTECSACGKEIEESDVKVGVAVDGERIGYIHKLCGEVIDELISKLEDYNASRGPKQ